MSCSAIIRMSGISGAGVCCWALNWSGTGETRAPIQGRTRPAGDHPENRNAPWPDLLPGVGGTADGREGAHVLLAPPFIYKQNHVEELVGKLQRTFNDVNFL